MVRGARRRQLKKTECRQLTLGIGCDGQRLVLTDQALATLKAVDGERIENYPHHTSGNNSIKSVAFSYEVQTDDLLRMFGGKDGGETTALPQEVATACKQELAKLRTSYEAQARRSILFAVNDPAIETLLAWSNDIVNDRYMQSKLWSGKFHCNTYGLEVPYLRAYIWERVASRALLYLSGYATRLWNPHLEDKDIHSVDCTYREAAKEWHFISHIHLSQLSEEASNFLYWPVPFPIDMHDIPKDDLIDTVYPDLCWEVGWLRAMNKELYDYLTEMYGPSCFDWQNMCVGLH